MEKLHILIIGTLPPPVGGTTVSLKGLVDRLGNFPDVELSVLDTGRVRGYGLKGLWRLNQLVAGMVVAIQKADVVTLHCCSPSSLGPTVLFLSRMFNKPLIIRKFGGNDYKKSAGKRWHFISESVLRRANMYLAQTHQLVEQAKSRGLTNVHWFPTSRPLNNNCVGKDISTKLICNKFVYVGHVREDKGMSVLSEAAINLPPDVIVDVYGPWMKDVDRNVFDKNNNITYKGELAPDLVISTMLKYDAFVYPTYHNGEGYPGVVLEALSAGLPIITTNWRAMSEVVDHTVGILVEPKNAYALCKAMTTLSANHELFRELISNTRTRAEIFSSDIWVKRFVEYCRKVV